MRDSALGTVPVVFHTPVMTQYKVMTQNLSQPFLPVVELI